MNEIENNGTLMRLPLWSSCSEAMRAEGIEHGKVYPAEYFEERLRCDRESMQFSLAISEIRKDLEKSGFYLSGRGQHGNQFVILPPESNQDIMRGYQRSALDSLKRGVILGTNTRLDLLPEAERRKHESLLEKLAIRAVLMNKTSAVTRALKKAAPELLKLAK